MTQKTCKELITENYKSRMDDLKILWDSYCKGEENVEDLGNLFEYGLSFDYVSPNTFTGQRKGYFRYQLSWGGPSDEFRIFTDLEYKPYKIEYVYLDWFDGAHKELSGKKFDFISDLFIGFFVDSGSAESEYKKSMEDYLNE